MDDSYASVKCAAQPVCVGGDLEAGVIRPGQCQGCGGRVNAVMADFRAAQPRSGIQRTRQPQLAAPLIVQPCRSQDQHRRISANSAAQQSTRRQSGRIRREPVVGVEHAHKVTANHGKRLVQRVVQAGVGLGDVVVDLRSVVRDDFPCSVIGTSVDDDVFNGIPPLSAHARQGSRHRAPGVANHCDVADKGPHGSALAAPIGIGEAQAALDAAGKGLFDAGDLPLKQHFGGLFHSIHHSLRPRRDPPRSARGARVQECNPIASIATIISPTVRIHPCSKPAQWPSPQPRLMPSGCAITMVCADSVHRPRQTLHRLLVNRPRPGGAPHCVVSFGACQQDSLAADAGRPCTAPATDGELRESPSEFAHCNSGQLVCGPVNGALARRFRTALDRFWFAWVGRFWRSRRFAELARRFQFHAAPHGRCVRLMVLAQAFKSRRLHGSRTLTLAFGAVERRTLHYAGRDVARQKCAWTRVRVGCSAAWPRAATPTAAGKGPWVR